LEYFNEKKLDKDIQWIQLIISFAFLLSYLFFVSLVLFILLIKKRLRKIKFSFLQIPLTTCKGIDRGFIYSTTLKGVSHA